MVLLILVGLISSTTPLVRPFLGGPEPGGSKKDIVYSAVWTSGRANQRDRIVVRAVSQREVHWMGVRSLIDNICDHESMFACRSVWIAKEIPIVEIQLPLQVFERSKPNKCHRS